MPEAIARVSPLAGVAKQGRFGTDKGAPGVLLSVRHPLSIVTVIARNDKQRALDAPMKKLFGTGFPAPGKSATGNGITVHWSGAGQWYVVGDGHGEGVLYRALAERLAGLASCSDQSHGRVTVRISGPKARDVLAKGTPIDLHPSAFGPGQSAVTQMAHVGVHLTQIGEDSFELSVFRGFSESFWEWLTEMSAEYGYQVS